jgi:hypothetical protein
MHPEIQTLFLIAENALELLLAEYAMLDDETSHFTVGPHGSSSRRQEVDWWWEKGKRRQRRCSVLLF